MATSTTNSTWRYVHGDGVANSSDFPSIAVKFNVVCTRDTGSQQVTWKITDTDWFANSYSGSYGYLLRIYVAVNPADPYDPDYDTELSTILEKDDTTGESWWNRIDTYEPAWGYQKFNSTSTTGTCYMYAEVTDCCRKESNTVACFYANAGSHFCLFDSFEVDLPTYVVEYPIYYDANGGQGAPATQIKKNTSISLQLTTSVPTYPLTVNYYNNADGSLSDSSIIYREFLHWNTARDDSGTSYSPGGWYFQNASCTMYAQWGSATLTTLSIPLRFFTVTYNYNGGTGSPASVTCPRVIIGYATQPGSTTKVYDQNRTYTENITTNLNLYPIYTQAVLSSFPTPPTRSGYMFLGWYLDAELQHEATLPILLSRDIILYAKWLALPLHKMKSDGTWENIGPYVWRFNGTEWQKVAHIYRFNGTSWEDLSE